MWNNNPSTHYNFGHSVGLLLLFRHFDDLSSKEFKTTTGASIGFTLVRAENTAQKYPFKIIIKVSKYIDVARVRGRS